jgi:signal transduction histidine kinase
MKWVMMSLFSFFDTRGSKKGLLTLVDITKQKMIDRAKTEFVSLASHQLRTPLSAMKWNMELLESAGKNSGNSLQSTYMKKIMRGLERMDLLVGDFLSASRLELGTLTPELTDVDLVPFLQSVITEHYALATQKEIAIRTDWGNGYGMVRADTHLLHMVVSNILGNALKYTSEGGSITLHLKRDASQVAIQISDTGIGIPLEEQKMIFAKMYRATNARTQFSEGTGLGLYIVQEIMHILGGSVTFESTVGVGTTFTIILQK